MNRAISSLSKPLAILPFAGAVLPACSGDDAAAPSCAIALSGDTNETAELAPDCATVRARGDSGSAGGFVLELDGQTRELGSIRIVIPLGAHPSPGAFDSGTVSDWSAVAAVTGDSTCTYAAGTESVPNGSFSLSLTSADAASAHGTIDVTLYVHAPEFTDCGPSDTEAIVLTF